MSDDVFRTRVLVNESESRSYFRRTIFELSIKEVVDFLTNIEKYLNTRVDFVYCDISRVKACASGLLRRDLPLMYSFCLNVSRNLSNNRWEIFVQIYGLLQEDPIFTFGKRPGCPICDALGLDLRCEHQKGST